MDKRYLIFRHWVAEQRREEFLLYSARSRVRELASGTRQLAGTRTRYRRAHAAPLAGLISGRAKYSCKNTKSLRDRDAIHALRDFRRNLFRHIESRMPLF